MKTGFDVLVKLEKGSEIVAGCFFLLFGIVADARGSMGLFLMSRVEQRLLLGDIKIFFVTTKTCSF